MDVNTENIKSQMRKGYLEYCILLILEKRPAYVSDIIEQLTKANLLVVEGTLYPLLTRLKNGGVLTYNWQESTQGPPRKYYELTDDGRKFLAELENSWNEIRATVKSIKNNNK